jgi:DNA-binding beta-propeller fold protein YncE
VYSESIEKKCDSTRDTGDTAGDKPWHTSHPIQARPSVLVQPSRGISLDSLHGYVYWTGLQGRGVSRISLDGAVPQKIISPAGDPGGIAINPVSGKVYWAEGYGTNRIMRANLDGSGAETLITTPTGYPEGLALDLVNRLAIAAGLSPSVGLSSKRQA